MTDSLVDTFRILDAAANRTREGLRVVEDFVRFSLNDGHLSQLLKDCRHELAAIMAALPVNSLLASRDTLQDVGTAISTAAEYQRSSPTDVVCAAFKRVQEAVRTLEEYSKVVDASLAPRFEQLRYRLWLLAEKSERARESSVTTPAFRTAAVPAGRIRTSVRVGRNDCRGALSAGVRIFQLREKSLPDRELASQARQLRAWTAAAGALLIINDRPDIAVLSAADGVHVGQEELSVQDARRIVGPDRIVGVSTHSIEQARQAVLDGADYLRRRSDVSPSQTKSFWNFLAWNS